MSRQTPPRETCRRFRESSLPIIRFALAEHRTREAPLAPVAETDAQRWADSPSGKLRGNEQRGDDRKLLAEGFPRDRVIGRASL